MYDKLCIIFLIILVVPSNNVLGKDENLKSKGNNQQEHSHNKRSLTNPRAKRQSPKYPNVDSKYDRDENVEKYRRMDEKLNNEPPFWGTRGRRESSEENNINYIPPKLQKFCRYCKNIKLCKFCFNNMNKMNYDDDSENSWERQSRNSLEMDDDIEPFWGNRGRRQEQDEPFWGNRGRRQDDSPFWGTRGRRDNNFPMSIERAAEEDGPFWGNRGRRHETEPFWGNRGRRMQSEELLGYENDDTGPFWGNRGRRKEDLKDAIFGAITDVESKIKHLSRFQKRQDIEPALSFWANRSKANKLKHLFKTKIRTGIPKLLKSIEPGTVLDDRIYAEEPRYILVERSSRSSAEEDPYFISRGRKRYVKYLKSELDQAARDRRGSIEDIVKSVRNDPYNIVRGKKDDQENKMENSTNREDFAKLKDLICSSVDLVTNQDGKIKRDNSEENERDRRNILKKLAAQLQIDPYFVSRGKKNGNDNSSVESITAFVYEVAEKCYN